MTFADRQAVLILGMHRSGTSAVAGAVNLLGVAPPARLLPPAADNPTGFWESPTIIGVNDRILRAAGNAWYDCLDFDHRCLTAEAHVAAETLIMASVMAEFGSNGVLLVKDPRLCLLLDLWLPALRSMQITTASLLVLRHPCEVMASVAQRDALPAAFTAALWLRHVLAAEHASRGSPRHILPYETLLRDWHGALLKAGQTAAIAWPVAIEAAAPHIAGLLRAGLRHHHADASARQSIGAPLGPWADDVYAALLALSESPDACQLRRLDQVREVFRDWCRRHGREWSATLLAEHAIQSQPRFDVPDVWRETAAALAQA
jgi:hypothetical protein